MSKLKRKVTVDNPHSTQEDNDRRKPSVFERLGPGAAGASRKYEDNICRNFLAGKCFYGTKCRFTHIKRKPERDDDSGSDDYSKPVRSKSTVSRRESDRSDGEEEMRGNKKLDFKKELELEKKRQQIERELKQLGAYEERENITIEKKISSSDDSSPERTHKKKKSPSKKKEKKKHKVKSPGKMKGITPSPEKKIKKFADPEKETAPKKKHKKKKSLEKKMAEISDEEVKPKKSKQKGMKSKTTEQKPRLSFQSEEDEEDTIVVKKNRQRSPSETPSRSLSRSRSWSQGMSRQHSPNERYEDRSPSPVQRKSKKGHRSFNDDNRQSITPEPRHPERRGRSSSYETPEEQMARRKGKKDSKKDKRKHEVQYQSESEESDYSRERMKVDKIKKHKKGRGDWSPESHDREVDNRSREPRKSSPVDYRDYKLQKERDKHSPGYRDHRRSMSLGSRHTDSRRDISPGSQRSGSQYHRDRRMSPPPDRHEVDDRYDKRDRGKDDPRRGSHFPSPEDRRYGKIHPGDRPDLDRGPDRYGDRRDIHEDRFEPPPRGEAQRGRYDDGRGFYDQRGRPESYDRDRFERDRYGQRIDPRGHPHRGDHRDNRGGHRMDPRVEPRFPEGGVYEDRGPPPPPEFRDPGWDRWQHPGPPGPYGRGGKPYNQGDRYRGSQRGGRFDIHPPPPPPERQSRRGDWERREFYVPERRDWNDRRDDHRDFSREDDRKLDRLEDKGDSRYDRPDRRNDDRDRSRGPRERYGEPNKGDPKDSSIDRYDRKESDSFKSREFSSDRGRDGGDKDIPKKERKISEPREISRPDSKREQIDREKKDVIEKVPEVKEKEKIEKVREVEEKEGKKEKDKGEAKKGIDKEKKKRTKAEKKARKEEKLKAKQKKLEDKLAKEKFKTVTGKESIIRSEDIKKEVKETEQPQEKLDSRKRNLSEERSKSVSPSPTHKRLRETSPAASVQSKHSLDTSEKFKVKEESEVKSEKSRPKSADTDKDNTSEKSYGSERKSEKKQKEFSPTPLLAQSNTEESKEHKRKRRSRSPPGEEEYKRRRTGEERDKVRKLRGSVDEEGGRFSDFTDDSADDILNQTEHQQTGSAIPEHVYRDGGRRRRSRSRSSYGSRHSHHDSRGHRSESSRYRDRRSRSRSRHRSGERDRRSRGEVERDRDQARPRSESESRVMHEQSEVKQEVKSELKQESVGESEDDLSLDSISSDEEFEAEHDKKQSIDALDIDWASLQQDVRPKAPTAGSALNRYKGSNIFAQIGVSKQYAGEELFNKIQNEYIKQEPDMNSTEDTEESKSENKFKFKSDIAVFHASITSKMKERRNLLRNIGPFRRALCARRDLEIRRQLCKVDKRMDNVHSYPVQVIDNEMYKLSVQLFKQSCKTPEKQELTEPTFKPDPIKQEVTCS